MDKVIVRITHAKCLHVFDLMAAAARLDTLKEIMILFRREIIHKIQGRLVDRHDIG
jgi:hypothetical protein